VKVKQLMRMLECEDPEAQVHFAYQRGDHWRTVVAPAVVRVEEGRVHHSDYHSTDVVLDEDDKRWDAAEAVVLLRS
jgi:hypothetical protein